MLARLMEDWKAFVCSWFHGGGDIYSDCDGVFWQCRKCKRVVR
jgi:hypothetical protein